MKILLVHNYYGSSAPSGENQVFEAELELLLSRDHEVITFTRHSDEIRDKGTFGKITGALATPWNHLMFMAIRRRVLHFKPDVVHVHNTFPLISPAIFYAIGTRAARVLTLHNYRLFCPAAIPMRAGLVCTDCIDGHTVWPGLQHGCYRNSRLATVPLVASVSLHRHFGTWDNQVDAFIVLSEFQRERMTAAGLPIGRVHVKPNFYPGAPVVVPWVERRLCAVFAGRLTAEKGVDALIRAWLLWGAGAPELRIVGDGELRDELVRLAGTNSHVPIRFLGQLTGEEAQAEIAHARLLVLPSEGFEGFPMVVREAFAFGTPAAVSDIGPLPFIVKHGVNGVVFAPADPCSLLGQLRTAWETPGLLKLLSEGARAEFESKYTREKNYDMLMKIYRQAISTGGSSIGGP